ncbi:MAG: LrgB family protein, partial [Janthinobacterium lividum]
MMEPTAGIQWLGAFCLLSTVLLYFALKRLYARYPRIWLMPLVSVPVILGAALLLANVPYSVYLSDTRWLLWLLGPTTIAFALPIYEYRGVIRRHWLSLSLGVSVGIVSGVAGSFFLAKLLHLPPALQRAVAIRSVSTPFALAVSGPVGASPDVVAVLVIITGLVGMLIGKALLVWLPMRSGIARGALFGAGAHGVGTA